MKYLPALTAAGIVCVSVGGGVGPATLAQSAHDGHATHAAKSPDNPPTKAYRAANAKMHRGMDIKFSNDADLDFVQGMIPHHQGAIDMAKVVLEYGKDEQTRAWAQAIIREQEREIGEMKAWLLKRGQ
jgi:uncharacterized protein (DUF305 family)